MTVLSVDAVRAQFAGLIGEDLILFPVRHHSPACALHLQRLFEEKPPSVVLVEGPRGFSAQAHLLTHEDMKAPVAFYTYTVERRGRDEPERRRAAYYPFCDYSPELVAFREAHRRSIPARFIDLDFCEQTLLDADADDAEQGSLLAERPLQRSQHLRHLAEQLGCRSHEELWEHLFEQNASAITPAELVPRVAAYCHLARLDTSDAEMTRDGTHAREAEMAWHIRQALDAREPGAGPVLVVVGGFHAVALPALLKDRPARPSIDRGSVREENVSLIRYSDERLDRLNGYASGMTSPAWHQAIWEQGQSRRRARREDDGRLRAEASLTFLMDIAIELRGKHRIALPAPAVAAAYEQALRLARLRGRVGPVRDDVLDAVTSCFIKGQADGDASRILDVARQILQGRRMGRVPVGAGTPPLVKDFAWRARRQRLRIDESEPKRSVLDLYRRPEHRTTSRLFHGLALLGVPFAIRTAGPDFARGIGMERLQEHWEYQYSPITEGALVEAALYGTTVPLAVANRFTSLLEAREQQGLGRDARGAASTAIEACVLGLHDHLPRVLQTLRTAINEDAAFEAVAAACSTLGLLCTAREPLEARDADELPRILLAAFERAVYLGADLGQPKEEQAEAIVEGLMRLRELLAGPAGAALDGALFWAMVAQLRRDNASAFVRGGAAGLLYSTGQIEGEQLGSELGGHLDGMTRPQEALAYLRGLLHCAREVAWQLPDVVKTLDRLLGGWDEDAFLMALPELRLAFADMTPRETDRVAEAVAALHGGEPLGRLVRYDLDETALTANVQLDARLQSVLREDGLAYWLEAVP